MRRLAILGVFLGFATWAGTFAWAMIGGIEGKAAFWLSKAGEVGFLVGVLCWVHLANSSRPPPSNNTD
jgi:hypothetical protein